MSNKDALLWGKILFMLFTVLSLYAVNIVSGGALVMAFRWIIRVIMGGLL